MIGNPFTWVRVLRRAAWAALLIAIFTTAFVVSAERRSLLVAGAIPLALSVVFAVGSILCERAPIRGTATVQEVLLPGWEPAGDKHRCTIRVTVYAPGFRWAETTLERLTIPANIVIEAGDRLPVEIRGRGSRARVRILWHLLREADNDRRDPLPGRRRRAPLWWA